jgi:hypothetical protein
VHRGLEFPTVFGADQLVVAYPGLEVPARQEIV